MRANIFLLILSLICFQNSYGQENTQKSTIAVLNVDAENFQMTAKEMSHLIRLEISHIGSYQPFDFYDMQDLLYRAEFNSDNCYSQLCMLEVGQILNTTKVLSGSLATIDEKIIVHLRLLNVTSGEIEKTQNLQFIGNENKVAEMIRLTLRKMFDQPLDENLLAKLSMPTAYQQEVNEEKIETLSLSGPRIGFTVFSGALGDFYEKPVEDGGFGASKVMMQMGYQFEVKYFTGDNMSALFEIVPTLTGLEHGIIQPSISVLNGFRDNNNGWEFAAGPILSLPPLLNGEMGGEIFPEPRANILMAVGKSFKSGRMNFPVNFFFIPGKNETHRYGISMGFNFQR